MGMKEEKQCPKCLCFKPVDQFRKSAKSKDGYDTQCKRCKSDSQRKYYKANRERILERNREYHKANREKINEQRRKQAARNRKDATFFATMKAKSSDVMAEIEAELRELEQNKK